MGKFVDLTGKKFGKLTVIKREGTNKNKAVTWLCMRKEAEMKYWGMEDSK